MTSTTGKWACMEEFIPPFQIHTTGYVYIHVHVALTKGGMWFGAGVEVIFLTWSQPSVWFL